LYFRINKNSFSQSKLFKRYKNIFVKKGKKSNLIVSGAILNHIMEMFDSKELENINIISLPIMKTQYVKNFKNYLVKGNTLFITDSSSSDNEDQICDKQSNINQLIQKQIEDDLATHDFSKPHVTREEIQEIIGMKIKNISYYQRSLVHKSIYKAIKNRNRQI
jgi:hypothetical protein